MTNVTGPVRNGLLFALPAIVELAFVYFVPFAGPIIVCVSTLLGSITCMLVPSSKICQPVGTLRPSLNVRFELIVRSRPELDESVVLVF